MVCSKAYTRVLRSVTRRHPSYGLKRRQYIARATIYSRKRHKNRSRDVLFRTERLGY
jgi:hypothetical protein